MRRFNLLPPRLPRPRRSEQQRSRLQEILRGIRDKIEIFPEDAADFVERFAETTRQRISTLDLQINPRNVLMGTLGAIATFSVGLHIYEIRQAVREVDAMLQLPMAVSRSREISTASIDDTKRKFRCHIKRTSRTKITPNCKDLPAGAVVSFTINPSVDCPNRDRNGYPKGCMVPEGQLVIRYRDSKNNLHTLESARRGWFDFPASVGRIWKMGEFEFKEPKAEKK